MNSITTTTVPGSLAHQARLNNQSLARTFVDAKAILLCDVSGSMDTPDALEGRTRYEQEQLELKRLQRELPGKIAIIAFSSAPVFCPGGSLPNPNGSTDLHRALEFLVDHGIASIPDLPVYLISDGRPDDQRGALDMAQKFLSKINCIFVGSDSDFDQGRKFLRELSAISGGVVAQAPQASDLSDSVLLLLNG